MLYTFCCRTGCNLHPLPKVFLLRVPFHFPCLIFFLPFRALFSKCFTNHIFQHIIRQPISESDIMTHGPTVLKGFVMLRPLHSNFLAITENQRGKVHCHCCTWPKSSSTAECYIFWTQLLEYVRLKGIPVASFKKKKMFIYSVTTSY